MEQKVFQKQEVSDIAFFLINDEIVCLPTETVYGVCVKASSYTAFKKMAEAKNRPSNKAFPLAVSSLEDIKKYATLTKMQEKVIKHFLNQSLTVVVNVKSDVPKYVTANQKTIALRLLDDPFIKQLIKEVKEPILLTSANLSGEKPVSSITEALSVFKNVKAFVEGELIENGVPSTIVSLVDDKPSILRQGKITLEEILQVMEG